MLPRTERGPACVLEKTRCLDFLVLDFVALNAASQRLAQYSLEILAEVCLFP
jgi:hypothetical protein